MKVVMTAFCFGFVAIVLGFAVDYMFNEPTGNESTPKLFFLIMMQLIVTTIIIYYFDILFESILCHDSDLYFGLTVFCVVFFLVQEQLFNRLSILFKRISGRNI